MNELSTDPRALSGTEPETFGDHMRLWRRIRGLSQLQLSVRADVSSRHVSFLESGRSKPSRPMVDTLADALDIPLRARNPILMAAGFAPVYRETSLDEPDARHIRHLLDMVLKGAEPFPALVVDRHWNVLMTNAGGALMLSAAGGEKGAGETGASETGSAKAGGLNMVDVILAPGPMRDLIVNWDEVVNDLLKRVRREADHAGDETVLNRMLALLPEGWKPPRRDTTDVPLVIPLHLRLPGADGTLVDLRFASIIGSLGTPADIGLAELAVETFLPADEATEAFLKAATAG